MLAEYEIERQGDVLIGRVRGEIDTSNAEWLQSELIEAVPTEARGFVADFTEVTYLDSAGVRLLFALARTLHERTQDMSLVVPDRSLIRRVLTLTKIDAVIPVMLSVPDALAEIRAAT